MSTYEREPGAKPAIENMPPPEGVEPLEDEPDFDDDDFMGADAANHDPTIDDQETE